MQRKLRFTIKVETVSRIAILAKPQDDIVAIAVARVEAGKMRLAFTGEAWRFLTATAWEKSE